VNDQKLNRRRFLRVAALGSAAGIVAACQPEAAVETVVKEVEKVVKETVVVEGTPKVVEKVVKETVVVEKESEEPVGFQGTIDMYAQAYTPTSVVVNPDPDAPKRYAMEVLAEAWMDLHPGVELKLIPAPTGNYHDWLDTQLIAGAGPDIFWLWLGSLNDHADRGKVVPLNDYLQMPNKYTPDDDRPWMEHFKAPYQVTYSAQGNWGGIPLDLVSTGIYANVDMLAEVGVDVATDIDPELGSPVSWAEWMDWHEALQDAGYIPASPGPGVSVEWWIWGVLADQFCRGWLDYMDVLNYHEDRDIIYQEEIISQEEVNHWFWCHDWNPFDQPEVVDMFRVVGDWSQYFVEGWTSADMDVQYEYWATGELCMVWDGSWRVGQLQQDDRRDFEFTSFWLPPVTQETSDFVPDPPFLPIGVGGYGSITYGLNHTVVEKGCVDECVDFLMWITTPEHNEMIVNEVPSFIPANKKAKALPEVENMFVGETRLIAGVGHQINNPFSYFGHQELKYGDIIRREIELFGLGEQSLEDTMDNMASASKDTASDLLRRSAVQYDDAGDWDLTQWDCEPAL
jgi:raffinose/stachyose/melibiose transport system substrate-binding protein